MTAMPKSSPGGASSGKQDGHSPPSPESTHLLESPADWWQSVGPEVHSQSPFVTWPHLFNIKWPESLALNEAASPRVRTLHGRYRSQPASLRHV